MTKSSQKRHTVHPGREGTRQPAPNWALALVLFTTVGGGLVGAWGIGEMATGTAISFLIPEEGLPATYVGGLAIGGIMGLLVPVHLIPALRNQKNTPNPRNSARQITGVLAYCVYLAALTLVASQLGWWFSDTVTGVLAVPIIGLSWVGLIVLPWRRKESQRESSPNSSASGNSQ